MSNESLPPRVGQLEQEVHTLRHRVGAIEETHKDTPHRLTRLEHALEDVPEIKRMQAEQGEMLRSALAWIKGAVAGGSILWALYYWGPDLLKIMGAR